MGRLCYPTQHPGRVLVPRASGARKLSRCKEGMAHFLPSGYKVCWVDAGSRYKVNKWTIICPGLSEKIKRRKSVRAASQLAVFVKTARSVFGKKCDKLIKPAVRFMRS